LKNTLFWVNKAERPDALGIRLLIVANACTDDTIDFLGRYYEQSDEQIIPMEWIEEPAIGKSNALNAAARHVDGQLVAFVDDDHRVDSAFFESVARAVDAYPQAGLFCGRIIPDWDGTEPSWVHDQGPYRIYPLPVPRFDLGEQPCELSAEGTIPGGGNLVMRTEVLRQVGRFSTELGPKGRGLEGSEDTDYVLRALALGIRGQYVPAIVQYHYVDSQRLTLRYILGKSYQRSRSVTRVRSDYSRIPAYLWRKMATYIMKAGMSFSWSQTRFYLVRLMAVLGEMRGILDNDQSAKLLK
jgi:GT2 family glycosyltransferase